MLEKDQNKRIDIKQADQEIKRINLKSKDIFEGIVVQSLYKLDKLFIIFIKAIEKDLIDDTDYYIQSTNLGGKDDNTKETPLLKGNLKDLIRNLK